MSRSNCSTRRWASTPSSSDRQRAARTKPAPSSASLHGGQSHHAAWALTSSVSSPGNASRQRPQRRGRGGRSLGAASADLGLAVATTSARPADIAPRRASAAPKRQNSGATSSRTRSRPRPGTHRSTSAGSGLARRHVYRRRTIRRRALVPAVRTGAARPSSAARPRRSMAFEASFGRSCVPHSGHSRRFAAQARDARVDRHAGLHSCNSLLAIYF